MPKIHGKQVMDNTILQSHLNLNLPSSGDTISGATVAYVNNALSGGTFSTVIGPAEDGTYTDGIFTDFTSTTPIGIAIDRFNEVLLKLAPTPPSDLGSSGPMTIGGSLYSARALSTGSVVTSITTSTTPVFTVASKSNGIGNVQSGTITFDVNGTQQDSFVMNGTSKTSGVIRFTVGDPYFGQAGKAGFWTGITSSIVSTSTILAPSASQKTANLIHTISGSLNTAFYVDSVLSPSVGSVSASMPAMTGHISGVPSLVAAQTVTGISFTINNAVSNFYNNAFYDITGSYTNAKSNNPPQSIPTISGQSVSTTAESITITSSAVYNDTSFSFTATGRNIVGTTGTASYTSSTSRIDTVSNETERVESSSGNYPVSYGGAFVSTNSLASIYTTEMQLVNAFYVWPRGNYTTYGGPDYSSITTGDNIDGTQYRWVTFNVGTKGSAVNNVTITINNATIGSNWNDIKMYLKIGSSGWLDATLAQSVQNPYNDGDGALDVAGSTIPNIRKITFGTIARSGVVYVRIGIKSTTTSYTFTKPTMT
jgi:hypothetical protein